MSKITIFNTWVSSENIGDKIIMESSRNIIEKIFEKDTFVELPTHTKLTLRSHRVMNNSKYKVVCGTNLLKSNMFFRRLWKLNLLDAIFLSDAILLGVGWKTYSKSVGFLTKNLWKRVLSKEKIHSVRDEYTKQKLNDIGIYNVINTSCPTMWTLTPEHCAEIPKNKGENVVATITDYRKNNSKDKIMFKILKNNYEKVYVWPQSYYDIKYINDLKIDNIELLPPNLQAYDHLLKTDSNIDYVGTRLHAGIRALQFKKRTIIIGVDNRALEKEKFGVNVLNRNNINELSNVIKSKLDNDIVIPIEKIERWKKQFQDDKNYTPKRIKIFDIYESFRNYIKKLLKYDEKQLNKK